MNGIYDYCSNYKIGSNVMVKFNRDFTRMCLNDKQTSTNTLR